MADWITADQVAASLETDVATFSIAKPANTVEGDFLLLFLVARDKSTTVVNSAGFTQNNKIDNPNNAIGPTIIILSKVAGASEPASYSIELSNTGFHTYALGRITGVDTANPFGLLSTNGNNELGSITVSGIAASANSLILGGGAMGNTEGPSTGFWNSTPAEMTELFNVRKSGSIGTTLTMSEEAGGTIGDRTWSDGGLDAKVAFLIEINAESTSITPNPITKNDGVTLVPEGTAVEHLYADDNKGTNEVLLETKYTDINGEVTFDLELPAGKVRYLRTIFQENGRDVVKEQFFSD